MKRLLAISLTIAAALLCWQAAAHELPTERKLVVDVGAESVEMMLVFQTPKSDAVMLLFQKYDIDGDGELTGGEAKLAGREWMPRMLHGLQFEVEGERPKAEEPQIKFRREDDGALSAAAYIKWSVDELGPEDTRTFHVRVLERESVPKTLVDMRPAGPLSATSFEAKGVTAGEPGKVLLEVGETATLELAREGDSKASE
ncbi:MAG: hypothetical protein ACQEVA_08270 [Myxococcota bacterium]